MIEPVVHLTDHEYSQVVGGAFADGADCPTMTVREWHDRMPVVYGILRGCDQVIKRAEWIGRPWLHIDHGYFQRGHFEGFYRISRNGLQAGGWSEADNTAPARWMNLRMRVKPWRAAGTHIVVVPPTGPVGSFYGIDAAAWLSVVMDELDRLTDRPVRVHTKSDETPFRMVLRDAWAVVGFNSNALVAALLDGVPVFTLGPAATVPMGSRFLCEIEHPPKPDREPWLWWLANQQWRLDEIKSGAAWAALRERQR